MRMNTNFAQELLERHAVAINVAVEDGSCFMVSEQDALDAIRAALSHATSIDVQVGLPPLPPVDGYDKRIQGHYSAQQMRDYARAALEASLPHLTQPAELAGQRGVTDAMVDAALSRWFNTEETSHCADIPEYKSDMRNSLTAAIAAAQGIDLVPLRRLYQAYVRLLESGRDRIIDLGGTCDPVEVMERMDINLIEARNLLGIKIDQRDAAPGVQP